MSKKENKKKVQKIITIICIVIFIMLLTYLIYYLLSKQEDKNDIKEVQEYMSDIVVDETSQITEKMAKIIELQEQNNDIKGWIEIENTKINFPLLQTDDNDYYLKYDYKKEKNKYGSIFLKDKCDINNVNSNLLIYGHNMNDEEMFNNLLKYKDKSFYEEHKIVKLTTENEERQYEIIAAFKSRIFYKDEVNVFRYYQTLNFENEKKYNEFISNVKKIQLYDTGVEAKFGEQLMTLITCEYSQENGRMVVVAKRIN